MYIYKQAKTSLLDVVNKITQIELCDDVTKQYQYSEQIAASEDLSFYDQEEIDAYYLNADDEEILSADPNTIHSFRNIDLLIRIGKLDHNLLSGKQQKYLKSVLENKNTDQITDQDIQNLLILVNKCNSVSYDFHHKKTNDFGLDTEGELRARMILRILRKLTVSDWKYQTRSINWNHLGNTLFVFKPKLDYVDKMGMHHNQVELYIKLDVDETTKSAVALVSMHE